MQVLLAVWDATIAHFGFIHSPFSLILIGNLVTKLGGKWEDYQCRGEIIDYSLDGEILVITQWTAWCEQEGVRKIIEEKFPSIKVYYREEESGCGVYDTNDASGDYFPERFFLNNTDEPLYFETIEETADYVSDLVGYKVAATIDDIQEALDKYVKQQENPDDVFYSFHEFQVVD